MPRCSRVRVNAVTTTVGNGNRNIDHFPRQRIQFTRCGHHVFYLLPGFFKQIRVKRQVLPEIVDVIRAARCTNIIKDRGNARIGLRGNRNGGHGLLLRK